jgi:hypothetical protein
MQLIALRDFSRTPDLKDVEIKDTIHDKHIHKGALFQIGTGKILKDVTPVERTQIATLVFARCVGDATDPKVVQEVKDEILTDKKREENAKRLNAASDSSALVAQLTALLQKAAAEPKAAAAK